MGRFFSILGLLLGLAATPAAAEEFKLGRIHIDQPWARASIGQAKAGAAYMTLVNHGDEVDRLVLVDTPVAKRATLHTHLMEDGVMKMRPVQAIEVAPGAPTVLAPGGLHVMLMGLKAPLNEGDSFPLTLAFDKAGTIEITVKVEGATAMGPAHGTH